MRSKRLRAVGLATAAPLAIALAACGAGGAPGGSGQPVDNLVVALQFTPKANWALETDDAFVLSQVGCLETLVRYNMESGELEPLLATSWEQTSPTEWEFELREGVVFQDGTPFTAQSVVDSLERLLSAEVPPRAFPPDQVSGIEAVDENTVRLTTPAESPLVPFRLASVNTGILAESAYTDGATSPIGTCTGPFTAVSQVPNQSITLERNEDYWGEKPQLATVEARFFPEADTRATQVRTNESQIALAVPISTLADLEADPQIAVTKAFTPRTSGLYLNNARAPFDNPEVRRAVQQALDLETIAKTIYNGAAEPAIGPFSPQSAWASDTTPVKRDVSAAKARLADAGIEEGELKLSLLAYTERAEFADLAAVIQSQLKEIGIDVQIETGDYSSMEPRLLSGDYDMSLLSRNQLTDIADPIGFLTADYTCAGTYNITQFCDSEIDAKITEAGKTTDPAARNAIYADVAEQLQSDAVTIFLVHEQTLAARRVSVDGFVDDPLGRYAVTNQLVRGAD